MVIILWVPQEPKPRITALTEPAAISPTEYLANVRVKRQKNMIMGPETKNDRAGKSQQQI
jgi:hypothetical protein